MKKEESIAESFVKEQRNVKAAMPAKIKRGLTPKAQRRDRSQISQAELDAGEWPSLEYIVNAYANRNLNLQQIADENGVDVETVKSVFQEYGINYLSWQGKARCKGEIPWA